MTHPVISTIIPEVIAATLFGYQGIVENDLSYWGGRAFHLAPHYQNGDYVSYEVSIDSTNTRTVYPSVPIYRGRDVTELEDFSDINFDTNFFSTANVHVNQDLNYLKTMSPYPNIFGYSISLRAPMEQDNQVLLYSNYTSSMFGSPSGTTWKSLFLKSFGITNLQTSSIAPNPEMVARDDIFFPLFTTFGTRMIFESIFNTVTTNTEGVYIGLLTGSTELGSERFVQIFVDDEGNEYDLYEPSPDTGYARQKMNPEDWDFAVFPHVVSGSVNSTVAVPRVEVTNNKIVEFPPLLTPYVDPIFAIAVYMTNEEGNDTRVITLPLKSRVTLNPGDAPANFQIGKLKFTLTTGHNSDTYK